MRRHLFGAAGAWGQCAPASPVGRGRAAPQPSTSPLGAGMRVPLTIAFVAVALVFQMGAHADPTLAQRFNFAKAVVLVRVVESTFPATVTPDYEWWSRNSLAKLLVIRSWKGSFLAGTTVTAGPWQFCGGQCASYPFQAGQELVIFVFDVTEPINVLPSAVVEGSNVDGVLRGLDALAVKPGT